MKRIWLIALCILLNVAAESQEYMPLLPAGGKGQLRHYIDQELIYPEACLASGTEGKVVIAFKTSEKGQVELIRFFQKLSPLCDQEAMRIFRMIEWHPATKLGIPIADSGMFEIEFNIKKYKRLCKKRGYSGHFYPFEPRDTSGIVYNYRNLETAPHPIFTNDKINLAAFIAANLQYPEAAIKQNLSGVVKIAFIVEPHGRPSNIQILNSLGAGCNEEAIRIARLIKWMPGTVNHMAVRTRMSISINFNLEPGNDGRTVPNIRSSYGG